jgi:hypothetical protein
MIVQERKLVRARHQREHTKKQLLLLESRVNKENDRNGVNTHEQQVEAFKQLGQEEQKKLNQLREIRHGDREEERRHEKEKVLKQECPNLCPMNLEQKLHRKVNVGLTRAGLTDLFGLQREEKMVVTQSDKRRMQLDRIWQQFNALVKQIAAPDPYLYEVDLQNMEVTDDMIKQLLQPMTLNQIVRKVNLINNKITSAGAAQIGNLLLRAPTIMVMLLGGNDIDDRFVAGLCKGLKKNMGLRELNLVGKKQSTNGFKELEHQRNFGSSEKFSFRSGLSRISPQGATLLANALRKNAFLMVLALGTHEIGDEGCGALADLLANGSMLEQLEIDNNGIGSEGGRKLGRALARNSSLTYLNVARNNLEDEAFACIGAGIKHNGTLAKLDVAHNHMGDAGAVSLMEGLDTRKGMAALRLHFEGNTNLGHEVALRLRLMSERSEGRLRTKFRKAAIRGRETLIEMRDAQRDAIRAQQQKRLQDILAAAGERKDTPADRMLAIGGRQRQVQLKPTRQVLGRRRKSIWKEEYVDGYAVQVDDGGSAAFWGEANENLALPIR